jgi:hypothetical protein
MMAGGHIIKMRMQVGLGDGDSFDGEFTFQIGQCVTHRNQSMPSLVLQRVRAGKREIYGVRSFANVDENRDRIMLGDCLRDVVPGKEDCGDCLLHNTGMCPRRDGAKQLR